MQNVTLIINPISGGTSNKQPLIKKVYTRLSRDNADVDVKYTSHRGEATQFALAAARAKRDMVVAIGGDGTINEVASGLVNTDVRLGIIPLGSGNGLARSLNIPMNTRRAVQLLNAGREYAIDVGKLNGRFFFLVAGVGFDALVGKSFDEHHTRGAIPYFYLSTRQYLHFQAEHLRVTFDGRVLEIAPFVLAVANGLQYGNNAYIAPQAKLNDGIFDLTIIHRIEVSQLLNAVTKLFTQRITDFAEAEFHQTREVTIERDSAGPINLDGEAVHESARLDISMLPASLKVIAPPDAAGLNR
jgi:YegS/Rv2252/BmrU family lipid kinase